MVDFIDGVTELQILNSSAADKRSLNLYIQFSELMSFKILLTEPFEYAPLSEILILDDRF
jgi:hypothetical protein